MYGSFKMHENDGGIYETTKNGLNYIIVGYTIFFSHNNL